MASWKLGWLDRDTVVKRWIPTTTQGNAEDAVVKSLDYCHRLGNLIFAALTGKSRIRKLLNSGEHITTTINVLSTVLTTNPRINPRYKKLKIPILIAQMP